MTGPLIRLSPDVPLPSFDEATVPHCGLVPDLNWAAGLFEGEGTITIAVTRNKPYSDTYRLTCIMCNTDREVVEFFQARWPGWMQPLYGKRPGRKPGWTWTVTGPGAMGFLTAFYAFFRTDRVRTKARLAIRFRRLQETGVRCDPTKKAQQHRFYEEMKRLNQRGTRGTVAA